MIFRLNKLSFVGSAFLHKFHVNSLTFETVCIFHISFQSLWWGLKGWLCMVLAGHILHLFVIHLWPLLTEYLPDWVPLQNSWPFVIWGLTSIVRISLTVRSSKLLGEDFKFHAFSSLMIKSATNCGSSPEAGPLITPRFSYLPSLILICLPLSRTDHCTMWEIESLPH